MINKTDRFSDQPLGIYQDLREVEASLEKPVSPSICHRLFHSLDATSHSLQGHQAESRKTSSIFQHSQQQHFAELQQKIVTLYGRAVDRKVDFQVNQIAEETAHLEEILGKASPEQVQSESSLLQNHVQALLHDHCLSKDNLSIIRRAKDILSIAQRKIQGKQEAGPTHHFAWLASQGTHALSIEESLDLMPGEVEEVFDIALLVFRGDLKSARSRFHQLPENIKAKVSAKCSVDMFSDVKALKRALIDIGYEISGLEGMSLSDSEIEIFLQEADSAAKNDTQKPPNKYYIG